MRNNFSLPLLGDAPIIGMRLPLPTGNRSDAISAYHGLFITPLPACHYFQPGAIYLFIQALPLYFLLAAANAASSKLESRKARCGGDLYADGVLSRGRDVTARRYFMRGALDFSLAFRWPPLKLILFILLAAMMMRRSGRIYFAELKMLMMLLNNLMPISIAICGGTKLYRRN